MKGTTKVLIGAAMGAMLGIMFAPNKGKKTRKKIRSVGKKLKKRFGKKEKPVAIATSDPVSE